MTYEKILPKFKEQHPNIDVKIRATYESYEDGTNTILREAVAGDAARRHHAGSEPSGHPG